MTARRRRLPFGAEPDAGGTRFRVRAPACDTLALRLADGRRVAMRRDASGWFSADVEAAGPGMRYALELASGDCVPDPASRFQPGAVEGESEVVDPAAYAWHDADWYGRPWREALAYELHVGCFGGDFDGVRRYLDHLERLGVTAVELMPVAAFAGARNWGYDGVLPFAPDASYGRPEALKRLVDACHERGVMALLDVVYNHFGPSGNHLARYAPDFFHPEVHTPWGAALAFDNPAVREFFIENALYWLQEFHFDGLRLDAVHAIESVNGGAGFLRELAERVRAETAGRHVHLVLENDRNEAHWLPRDGAPGLYTAQWNDDFHHAAHVVATGEDDGYYADYIGAPVRYLAKSLAEGFAYQGEPSTFRDGRRRGEPSAGVTPSAFVDFLQNHDQVGNRALGERLGGSASLARRRALYVLLMLSPPVPLLFMGEEWDAATPFLFFCDFPGDLGDAVREGRRDEFRRFAAFGSRRRRAAIPDPNAVQTYRRSRLDWDEPRHRPHADWLAFMVRLAACRRSELVPRLKGAASGQWRMLSRAAFVVEWPLGAGERWQVAANFGEERVTLARAGRVIHGAPDDDADLAADGARVTLVGGRGA